MLERHALPVAAELLEHFPGLIIEGARQVGKSTLATQLAGQGAVVATLDDEQTRAAAADAAGFVAQAGQGVMVIDEIQKMPELTLAVKASIDRDRHRGRRRRRRPRRPGRTLRGDVRVVARIPTTEIFERGVPAILRDVHEAIGDRPVYFSVDISTTRRRRRCSSSAN